MASYDMTVKPNDNYELLGTTIKLNKKQVYKAHIAFNQPDYKQYGLIYVDGVLLNRSEYRIVKLLADKWLYYEEFLLRDWATANKKE